MYSISYSSALFTSYPIFQKGDVEIKTVATVENTQKSEKESSVVIPSVPKEINYDSLFTNAEMWFDYSKWPQARYKDLPLEQALRNVIADIFIHLKEPDQADLDFFIQIFGSWQNNEKDLYTALKLFKEHHKSDEKLLKELSAVQMLVTMKNIQSIPVRQIRRLKETKKVSQQDYFKEEVQLQNKLLMLYQRFLDQQLNYFSTFYSSNLVEQESKPALFGKQAKTLINLFKSRVEKITKNFNLIQFDSSLYANNERLKNTLDDLTRHMNASNDKYRELQEKIQRLCDEQQLEIEKLEKKASKKKKGNIDQKMNLISQSINKMQKPNNARQAQNNAKMMGNALVGIFSALSEVSEDNPFSIDNFMSKCMDHLDLECEALQRMREDLSAFSYAKELLNAWKIKEESFLKHLSASFIKYQRFLPSEPLSEDSKQLKLDFLDKKPLSVQIPKAIQIMQDHYDSPLTPFSPIQYSQLHLELMSLQKLMQENVKKLSPIEKSSFTTQFSFLLIKALKEAQSMRSSNQQKEEVYILAANKQARDHIFKQMLGFNILIEILSKRNLSLLPVVFDAYVLDTHTSLEQLMAADFFRQKSQIKTSHELVATYDQIKEKTPYFDEDLKLLSMYNKGLLYARYPFGYASRERQIPDLLNQILFIKKLHHAVKKNQKKEVQNLLNQFPEFINFVFKTQADSQQAFIHYIKQAGHKDGDSLQNTLKEVVAIQDGIKKSLLFLFNSSTNIKLLKANPVQNQYLDQSIAYECIQHCDRLLQKCESKISNYEKSSTPIPIQLKEAQGHLERIRENFVFMVNSYDYSKLGWQFRNVLNFHVIFELLYECQLKKKNLFYSNSHDLVDIQKLLGCEEQKNSKRIAQFNLHGVIHYTFELIGKKHSNLAELLSEIGTDSKKYLKTKAETPPKWASEQKEKVLKTAKLGLELTEELLIQTFDVLN